MITQIAKMTAVVLAAILLGNWFLAEIRSARRRRLPWYAPYLTPAGILIVLAILGLPILLWLLDRS
jgi:hypothetical protein